MKKLSLIVLVAVLFGVSGCSLWKTDLPVGPEEKDVKVESDVANEVLDTKLYKDAVSANNGKFCDKILDDDLRGECKDVIESSALTAKAVATRDKTICSGIAFKRYEEACAIEVEEMLAQDPKSEVAKEKFAKLQADREDIMNRARTTNDTAVCEELDDVSLQFGCKYELITKDAIAKKDSSLCEKIGERIDLVNQCKSEVSNVK